MTLLIENIGTLALVGRGPVPGPEMGGVDVVHDAVVLIEGTTISWISPRRQWMRDVTPDEALDAGGGLVIPGLIDPHTHLCWAHADPPPSPNSPQSEIRSPLSYPAGVRAAVAAVREATRSDLAEAMRRRLHGMLVRGVTTVEIKTGFGLSLVDELKCLEAVQDLTRSEPIEIAATFLGAHVVPPEFDDAPAEFLEQVIKKMIPAAAHGALANFVDAFCDAGGFTVEQARAVAERAAQFDLPVKVHAGLFEERGAARLAAEIGAISADHLVHVRDNDLILMQIAGTIPVLLPGAAAAFGTAEPPARKMIERGLAVALGSDVNPIASAVDSLAQIPALAAARLGMSPEEILTACTANAAAALGRAGRVGGIEPGMQADLVLLEGRTLMDWVAGCPVRAVVKHGRPCDGRLA